MSSRIASSERGSAMIMSLVFVTVVALVVTSLMTLTMTNLRTTTVVRSYADRTYAVDAALEHAIRRTLLDRTLCSDSAVPSDGGTDPSGMQDIVIDGTAVELTCSTLNGSPSGAGGWAVIVTDVLHTQSGSNARQIAGPVFAANGFDLQADLDITDGAAYSNDCDEDARLDVEAPFSFVCTTSPAPDPHYVLPSPATMAVRSGLPDPIYSTAGCSVFLPGRYATAPVLTESNYFVSGDYYFGQGVGVWAVNSDVVAGTRPGEAGSLTACRADPPEYVANAGARLIFGGDAALDIQNQGRMEIWSPTTVSDGTSHMAIQAVTDDSLEALVDLSIPTAPYTSSTASLLVNQANGSTTRLWIHGRLYAPSSSVVLNPQGSLGESNVDAGLVARELTLKTGNATGLSVSALNSASPWEVQIDASAPSSDGTSAIVGTVVVRFDNQRSADDPLSGSQIDSWVTRRGSG